MYIVSFTDGPLLSPHMDIRGQTKLTMGNMIGSCAAALQMNDYFGAASCGKDWNEPNTRKAQYLSLCDIQSFPNGLADLTFGEVWLYDQNYPINSKVDVRTPRKYYKHNKNYA
jgi:hypothetical protein